MAFKILASKQFLSLINSWKYLLTSFSWVAVTLKKPFGEYYVDMETIRMVCVSVQIFWINQ